MDIIIISLVTFFAALLTFFSGFGLGTILTPVMLLYFPVEIAIAFTGIVHFSNNIFKLFIIGKNINKNVLIRFGIPAIIAAFFGSFLLIYLNEYSILYTININSTLREITTIKFVISLLLIVFAVIDLIPFFKKLSFKQNSLPIGGIMSGFFGGLTGNQGALRSAFLIKIIINKKEFIATTVVISSLVDISRLSVYSSYILNINLDEYYVLGFFSVGSAIIGSIIGNKLLKKVTIDFIRFLVAVLILIIATALLVGLI